jgi:hypothetical protein
MVRGQLLRLSSAISGGVSDIYSSLSLLYYTFLHHQGFSLIKWGKFESSGEKVMYVKSIKRGETSQSARASRFYYLFGVVNHLITTLK